MLRTYGGIRNENKNTALKIQPRSHNALLILKQSAIGINTGINLHFFRCELKERRREVSQLKQENLEREFKIQELERVGKEKDSFIKAQTNEEEALILK